MESIIEAIAARQLRQGQSLPSVNDFMRELSLSRMTILKALNELKDRGIVESKNRVGYFVRNEDIDRQQPVVLSAAHDLAVAVGHVLDLAIGEVADL